MKWSKAEKEMSDKEFPFRVLIKNQTSRFSSSAAAPIFGPESEVMNWLFEHVGNTLKAPTQLVRAFNRRQSNSVTKALSDLEGKWFVKTQGRMGYKFFFKRSGDAVAFKLYFSEKYNISTDF